MTILAAAWHPIQVTAERGGYPALMYTGLFDGYFDNSLLRQAFQTTPSYDFSVEFAPQTEVWFHFNYRLSGGIGAAKGPIAILRSRTYTRDQYRVVVNRVTISFTDFYNVSLEKSLDGGTSWVAMGSGTSPLYSLGATNRFDIHIVNGASGLVEMFSNGVQSFSETVDTLSQDNIFDNLYFTSPYPNNTGSLVHDIIISTTSTLGQKICEIYPTGSGNSSDFSGSYTDIYEVTVNESNFIASNTTNAVSTFTMSDIPAAYSNYNIAAFIPSASLSIDSGATPNDFKFVYRTGGTDYVSANLGVTKNNAINLKHVLVPLNPATSAPWTYSEINGIELGVKAV